MNRSGTHFVYLAFSGSGELLYVGCTHAPSTRQAQHRSHSSWWSPDVTFVWEGPFSASVALCREDELIWSLGPLCNKPCPFDYYAFGLCEDGVTPLPEYDPTAAPLPCPAYGFAQAARLMGVSRRRISLAVDEGMPALRRHGRTVVLRDDLIAWFSELPIGDFRRTAA